LLDHLKLSPIRHFVILWCLHFACARWVDGYSRWSDYI
jgi:hypothetical protein